VNILPGGRRSDYDRGQLLETDVDTDPFVQLGRWLNDAEVAGVVESTAMAVSTVGEDGRVTSRNVLLRGLDTGFVFFTNYESAKADDLAARPQCALLFSWLELQRQIRVEGMAARLNDSASDEYFAARPRGSQIGAWASPQSQRLADRAELEASVAAAEQRFDGVDRIPRPPNWGGYRVLPDAFEFWQGRPSRLHDRLSYVPDGDSWVIRRLAP
jgi:pyridoxamine 5'-phosphate oxidase